MFAWIQKKRKLAEPDLACQQVISNNNVKYNNYVMKNQAINTNKENQYLFK